MTNSSQSYTRPLNSELAHPWVTPWISALSYMENYFQMVTSFLPYVHCAGQFFLSTSVFS